MATLVALLKRAAGMVRSQPRINAVSTVLARDLAGALRASAHFLTSRWHLHRVVDLEMAGQVIRMRSLTDDGIVDKLFYGTPWEVGGRRAWSLLCGSARGILDVGANTGIYTLLAAAINRSAPILAFEPHPANFARLVDNLALNASTLATEHVHLFEEAVGDVPGRLSFTIPADGSISVVSSAVSAFTTSFGAKTRQIDVKRTTIDEIVEREALAHVDLIKIDVETYELFVLLGAEQVLTRHRPTLMLEVFDPVVVRTMRPSAAASIDLTAPARIAELLRAHGYSFFEITTCGVRAVTGLGGHPEEGGNYIATCTPADATFLPWSEGDAIARMMPHALP